MPTHYAEVLKFSLIFVAVATIPVLIWYLFDAVLIVVGALVLAALLRLGSEPFTNWLGVPQSLALVLSGLLILAFIAGAGFLFGTAVSTQFQEVVQRAGSAEQAMFAAPITVIVFVAVKKLYVRDTLGERTEIPGEAKQR